MIPVNSLMGVIFGCVGLYLMYRILTHQEESYDINDIVDLACNLVMPLGVIAVILYETLAGAIEEILDELIDDHEEDIL